MSDDFKEGAIDLRYKDFPIESEWFDGMFDYPIVKEKEASLAQKVETKQSQ